MCFMVFMLRVITHYHPTPCNVINQLIYNLVDKHTQISRYHALINVFYHIILNYSMASGNIIDENIKSLCYLLWIFETRIAITIMTDQHQHHDCEEDILMFDIIK